MERIPSFGIFELLIIAAGAGLLLLVGAGLVALVVKQRRDRRARAAGEDESQAPRKGPRARWIWIVVLALFILAGIPLLLLVGGILLITPVGQRVERGPAVGPAVHVVGEPIEATRPPAVAAPTGPFTRTPWVPTPTPWAPTRTPWAMTAAGEPTPGASAPAQAPSGRSTVLSLDPFHSVTVFVALPGLAGLAVLLGAALVMVLGRGGAEVAGPSNGLALEGKETKSAATARTRRLLLAVALWFALSAFLVLDLVFSVSLYWQFVLIYAAFWVLVGAVLLTGSRALHKILILGLFLSVLVPVHFVNWNTQKPFLRAFRSLEEGMTAAQVDEIMGGYMKDYQFEEGGEIVSGRVTYRHTDEAWGNSDWGVVTFVDGRVAALQFLHD